MRMTTAGAEAQYLKHLINYIQNRGSRSYTPPKADKELQKQDYNRNKKPTRGDAPRGFRIQQISVADKSAVFTKNKR